MITLLYWQELDASELNAVNLVAFMGGEIRCLDLSAGMQANGEIWGDVIPAKANVIACADTLVELTAKHSRGAEMLGQLMERAAKCFIYGFEANAAHGKLANYLTSGGLADVAELPVGAALFSVAPEAHEICKAFAGLTFGQAEQNRELIFVEAGGATGCTSLVRIGRSPFFVVAVKGNCELLLLACRPMASLDEAVPRDASLVNWFSRLAPLLMFVRRAEGTRCWHNDTPRACLILDDPLLKKQYGFLDFKALLAVMEREQFATTIAFIPWNYRRSDSRTAELFKKHSDRLTLCVHGCDHVRGEFGNLDFATLQKLGCEGLRRMVRHEELAGIGFDDVMVFPQGIFSSVAMSALQFCGFLAAVNSSPFPVDGDATSLRLRDLVDGAVTKFSGFPLFTRHYPTDLAGQAFALLLGKPALLVEHHGYFRNGYAPLVEVVQKLKQMEPHLEWSRLSVICSQTCWQRRAANGDLHVRFYADRFTLRNELRQAQQYVLFRRQVATEPTPEILIDQKPVSFEREGDYLKFFVELKAGQKMEVVMRRTPLEPFNTGGQPGMVRQVSVLVRRHLSEFRDNYMDKNLFISRMASRVRNHLVEKK
jgi:hypothetical protein